MMTKIAAQSEKISFILLPLLCFMVPISTFGTTVCLLSVILLWLVTGDYAVKMNLFWQHPIARAFLILMLGAMVSLLYTQAETKEIYNGIKDNLRLCAISVFIYYFLHQSSDELKNKCIKAFVWAMILTVILSYLKYFFHLLPHKQGLTEAAVFKNHIKTSFYMSIAAYFIANALRIKPKQLVYWIALILLTVNILFLSEGRVGYIIFSILAMYFFWSIAKTRGLFIASSLLLAVVFVSQQFSLKIHERFVQIPKDIAMFSIKQDIKTSSIGSRFKFIEASKVLIEEKPWLGWGVGSYKQAYQSVVPEENLRTSNPHNEYLRLWVEFGTLGLMWFVYLIFTVFRQIFILSPSERVIIGGIWFVFLIGCVANSWLMDFSEGIFIVMILSMFLGKSHADNVIRHRHDLQLAPGA